jgi:hypothetical protein
MYMGDIAWLVCVNKSRIITLSKCFNGVAFPFPVCYTSFMTKHPIIPTLTADASAVVGDVSLPDNWNRLDPLIRADLLKDWIRELNVEYDRARDEIARPFQNTHDRE